MPCRLSADVGGLWRELKGKSGVETLLDGDTVDEKSLAGLVERAVKGGEEGKGLIGEDLVLRLLRGCSVNLDALNHGDEAVEVGLQVERILPRTVYVVARRTVAALRIPDSRQGGLSVGKG